MSGTRTGEAAAGGASVAPLSVSQAALLDAVADRLVPRDEHGPGAVDIGATRYVARGLSGELAEHVPAYRAALDALDRRARERHGGGFTALDAPAQDALLAELERDDPAFFALVWGHVLELLLGDPAWGGNQGGAGWRLIGYGGPQPVWSEADQRIAEGA